MFKVGDKVEYVFYNETHGITDFNFKYPKGTIFTVSSPIYYAGGTQAVKLKELNDAWYMPINCIRLLEPRKPITNEVEWLDRVRDNFKE